MYELKKIDARSSAKIYALLIGTIYGVVALLFLIFNIIMSAWKGEITFVGVASAVLALFLVTILSAAFGALTGGIIAWLYNVVSAKVGGVRIDLGQVSKVTRDEK